MYISITIMLHRLRQDVLLEYLNLYILVWVSRNQLREWRCYRWIFGQRWSMPYNWRKGRYTYRNSKRYACISSTIDICLYLTHII